MEGRHQGRYAASVGAEGQVMTPVIKLEEPRWKNALCYCCGHKNVKAVVAVVLGHEYDAGRGNTTSVNMCDDCMDELARILK